MKTTDFNEKAGTVRYGYTPSPVHPHGFQILLKEKGGHDVPVGEYIVLDGAEDLRISARKVANLVSVLGGQGGAVPLGPETGARTLYHVISEKDEEGFARILFSVLEDEGVSKENAFVKLEIGSEGLNLFCEKFAESCSISPLHRVVAPPQVSCSAPEGPSRQI